jgi:two-component system chemotaxis response regulator CheB
MIRVLVAENSRADRSLLRESLRTDSQISVVGEARSGAEAVRMTARLRPQVVAIGTLDRSSDMHEPIDRLAVTRQIMSESPTPIVVALDEHEGEGEAREALAAGAVAVLRKPAPNTRAESELVETIRAMAEVKVVGQRLRKPHRSEPAPAGNAPFGILAIAASTGGPAALARVLRPLPRELPVPVVIVQHLAAGFVGGFTSWLDQHCALEVQLAHHAQRLSPGVAYIGADGAHMRVLRSRARESEGAAGTLALSEGPPRDGFCPSASVLFESVAKAYGAHALAVILTGMGRDGVSGLAQVRAAGGRIIAQDQHTSVVFGMPSVAIQAGLADLVLPIDLMAPRILELLRAKERR